MKTELLARRKGDKILCATISCRPALARCVELGEPDAEGAMVFATVVVFDEGWAWSRFDRVWALSRRAAERMSQGKRPLVRRLPPGAVHSLETRYVTLAQVLPTRVVCPTCRRVNLIDSSLGVVVCHGWHWEPAWNVEAGELLPRDLFFE